MEETTLPSLTDWYPGDVKPARVGCYERDYSKVHGVTHLYDFWDGSFWHVGINIPGGTPNFQYSTARCLLQNLPWRGLSADPYAQAKQPDTSAGWTYRNNAVWIVEVEESGSVVAKYPLLEVEEELPKHLLMPEVEWHPAPEPILRRDWHCTAHPRPTPDDTTRQALSRYRLWNHPAKFQLKPFWIDFLMIMVWLLVCLALFLSGK